MRRGWGQLVVASVQFWQPSMLCELHMDRMALTVGSVSRTLGTGGFYMVGVSISMCVCMIKYLAALLNLGGVFAERGVSSAPAHAWHVGADVCQQTELAAITRGVVACLCIYSASDDESLPAARTEQLLTSVQPIISGMAVQRLFRSLVMFLSGYTYPAQDA